MDDALTPAAAALRQALDELLAAPVLAGDAVAGLETAVRMRTLTEDVIAASVQRARREGASWQAIGTQLGVSRQAAFQRYGKPIDPRTGAAMNTTPLAGADALAIAVIEDLAAARWEAITARFDDTMRQGLSADALAAAWAQIIGQAGAFEGHDAPECTRAADVTITNTALHHEAGDFVARIAFRDDQSIAGLFILTPEQAS